MFFASFVLYCRAAQNKKKSFLFFISIMLTLSFHQKKIVFCFIPIMLTLSVKKKNRFVIKKKISNKFFVALNIKKVYQKNCVLFIIKKKKNNEKNFVIFRNFLFIREEH